jgi:O-antigen/teichoic acid export membrane protein
LTVGKTSLQGLEDRRGGDTVIAAEELAFLPCYALPLLFGVGGTPAIIIGLASADLLVAFEAWRRVARQLGWRPFGFARTPDGWWGRPDLSLGRRVCSYGMRGQLGGFMTLLNLRLDFAILGAMAGPAVLGTYAVASKFAELLKLPGTAITWVSYPRLANAAPPAAATKARSMIRPSLALVMLAAVPLAVFAGPVLTGLYGSEFSSAIAPSRVLICGMLFCGASGVASGYLYGRGRPGLNSVGMGVGLVLTVVLDVILIPHYSVMGASVASTVSYVVTDLLLIGFLFKVSRGDLERSSDLVRNPGIRVPTP